MLFKTAVTHYGDGSVGLIQTIAPAVTGRHEEMLTGTVLLGPTTAYNVVADYLRDCGDDIAQQLADVLTRRAGRIPNHDH